jgi:hypothetical protein
MEPILTKDIKKKSVCVSKILSSKHKWENKFAHIFQ